MKKKVTIKFNVGLTLVFLLYGALHFPFMEETVVPMDKIFESTPGLAFGILFFFIPLSLVIFMHAVRAVWNRLFPKLCGWEEIGLAEAYALSLLVAFFSV